MNIAFSAVYTEPMVRAAVNRFWLRTLGWKFIVALLVLAAVLASEVIAGDRSWRVGFFGAIVGLGGCVIVAGWVAQRRRALEAFRNLENGSADFDVREDRLVVRSAQAAAEIPWRLICEVWRYPTFWLLVFSRNSFSTLPTAGVPRDALSALEERVRDAGGALA